MSKNIYLVPVWDAVKAPWPKGKEFTHQLAELGWRPVMIAKYSAALSECKGPGLKKRIKRGIN